MEKRFIIYNLETLQYYYGYTTTKEWTRDVKQAQFYYDEENAVIKSAELGDGVFHIITVYTPSNYIN